MDTTSSIQGTLGSGWAAALGCQKKTNSTLGNNINHGREKVDIKKEIQLDNERGLCRVSSWVVTKPLLSQRFISALLISQGSAPEDFRSFLHDAGQQGELQRHPHAHQSDERIWPDQHCWRRASSIRTTLTPLRLRISRLTASQ